MPRSATQRKSIYNQAVNISEEYLGPAGERFIRRQISTHLGIEPEDLQKKDVVKLIDWATLAFALLTNNPRDVEDFTQGLSSLTNTEKRA